MQPFDRSRKISQCLAIAALAVVAVLPVSAQTTATEILGLVTDTSGASVTGAKVTIIRVACGSRKLRCDGV